MKASRLIAIFSEVSAGEAGRNIAKNLRKIRGVSRNLQKKKMFLEVPESEFRKMEDFRKEKGESLTPNFSKILGPWG